MVLPQNKSHDVVCDCAAADINVYFQKVGRRVVHHLREVGRDESIRIHQKKQMERCRSSRQINCKQTFNALPTIKGFVPTARCTTQGPCSESNVCSGKSAETARTTITDEKVTRTYQRDVWNELEASVPKLIIAKHKPSKQRFLQRSRRHVSARRGKRTRET